MKKRLLTSIAIPLLLVAVLVGVLSASVGPIEVVQAAPAAARLFPPTYPYSTFLSLIDTPGSYSGEAGRVPVVNSGETALEWSDTLYLNETYAWLGVGVTPMRDFHVYDPTANVIAQLESGDAQAFLEFKDPDTDYYELLLGAVNGDFRLYTGGAPRLIVLEDLGDVGIADTTPSYKLDVAGTIRAQEDLRADDDLTVGDDAHVDGLLIVNEQSFFYGNMTVGGVAPANVTVANGNVAVADGNVTATDVTATGDLSAGNDLLVTDAGAFGGNVTASGNVQGVNVTATDDLYADDDLFVTDYAEVGGDTQINGHLAVGQQPGRDIASSNITVTGNIDVAVNIVAGVDITAGNDATVNDYLDVNGSATFGDVDGGPFESAIYAERDTVNAIWGRTNSEDGAVAIYGAAPSGGSSTGIMGEGDYGVIGWGYTNTTWSVSGGFFHQDAWVDQSLFVSNSGAVDQDAGAGKGNLIIGQSHSLPYGPLNGAAALYVNSGELYVLDAYSNTTQLSPHNAEGDWIFYSVDMDGKVTYINMIEVIMAMEELTGKKFVHDVVPEGEKREYTPAPTRPIPQPLLPTTMK